MTKKRAAIYVRLSSHRGEADPSTSPGTQRKTCEAYCVAKGWEVVEVIEDLDVSGSDKGLRLDRPGLKKVRQQWASIDVVVFAKLDRLARNVVDFRDFSEEAAEHGVALVSVHESLDMTTPSGRFVATILAAFAEMEAAAIAERITAGRASLAELRRHPGGRTPYGYRTTAHPSGKGRALELDPDAAAVIREAVERVIAGESTYAVARDFQARSISAGPAAAGWTGQRLRQILLSPASRGYLTRKGQPVRDADGMPEKVWPELVTDAQALQLMRRFPGEPRATRKALKYPLSGLLRCHSCGSVLLVSSPRKGVTTYRCQARVSNPEGCEAPVSINRDLVEPFVFDAFLGAVGAFPVTRFEVVGEPHGDELAAIEVELQRAGARMADPSADVAAIVEQITALRARREALAAMPAEPIVRAVPTGRTFAEEWEQADDRERRELLGSVLEHAVVSKSSRGRRWTPTGERVRLVWRNMYGPEVVDQ